MKELEALIVKFAESSLWCLCLAYKDLKQNEGGKDHDDLHDDKINR